MGFVGQVRVWPAEWEDYLLDIYGLYDGSVVAEKMSARFNYRFTLGSVAAKARRLNLVTATAQADYIMTHAARALRCSTNGLRGACVRLGIKPYGSGSKRYIGYEDFLRLTYDLAPPPEPCMSTKQAAKLLYFAPNSILLRLEKGELRGYRCKGRWMVSIASIHDYRERHDMVFRRIPTDMRKRPYDRQHARF